MSNLGKPKISFSGRLNASILLAITPEYPIVRRRKVKSYGTKPTFERPASLPMEFEEIEGVRIRYARSGPQDAPTIILLSPLPQSIVAFAPIWQRLTESYNVYAYDMPGFGRSEGGKEYMNFEAQGRFLGQFIESHNIRRPHIVGPDIGMPAALYYVIHLPNEVESLVIGDGPGIMPSSNGSIINKMVQSKFWRMVFSITGSNAFVHGANCIGYINYSPNQEEVSDYIKSYKGRIRSVMQWFRNYSSSIDTVDPKLADIDTPTLIFWGDQDQFLLLDNAERLNQRLKKSKLHVFDNCGHFSYQDKYSDFSIMLSNWVDGQFREV